MKRFRAETDDGHSAVDILFPADDEPSVQDVNDSIAEFILASGAFVNFRVERLADGGVLATIRAPRKPKTRGPRATPVELAATAAAVRTDLEARGLSHDLSIDHPGSRARRP